MTKEREKEISDDEAEDDEKGETKGDGDEDKEKVGQPCHLLHSSYLFERKCATCIYWVLFCHLRRRLS